MIAFSLCLIILGVLVTFGFSAIVNLVIDHQVALRPPNGQSYGWWAKPPVTPAVKVYVYNVTNADEFLNNGSKPILEELGPYVYRYVLTEYCLLIKIISSLHEASHDFILYYIDNTFK